MDWRPRAGSALGVLLAAACAAGAAPAPNADRAAGGGAPSVAQADAVPARPLERVSLALPALSGNYVPHWLAAQRGFYQDEGLEVSLPVMRATLLSPAMAAGEVDYQSLVGVTIRNALAGLPERVVAVSADKSTRALVVSPGIRSVEQLRGRSIAVNGIGSGPYMSGVLALEHFGIDPNSEITWLTVDGLVERALVVQQGTAQASVFNGPEVPRAEKLGLTTLLRLDGVAPIPEGGLSTSVQKLATQPDQVKRMARALVRASQLVQTDRAVGIAAFAEFLQVSREEAEEAYDAVAFAFSPQGTISEARLRYTIDTEKRQLNIADEVPFSRVADFGPLHQALAELGLQPPADSAR